MNFFAFNGQVIDGGPVGAALFPAAGSAAGGATASGVGAALSPVTGTAVGAATASGVGVASAPGAGSAVGLAIASGVGASFARSAGSAAGVATASAVGSASSAGSASGSAIGSATASGVGAALSAAAGTATGLSAASGVGAASAAGAGSAVGLASASGVGSSSSVQPSSPRYVLVPRWWAGDVRRRRMPAVPGTGFVYPDFWTAFVAWWHSDADMPSRVPGGLVAPMAAPLQTLPFARMTEVEPQSPLSDEDWVMTTTVSFYTEDNEQAWSLARLMVAKLNDPARPRIRYDGWMEAVPVSGHDVTVSQLQRGPNNLFLYRADVPYDFHVTRD